MRAFFSVFGLFCIGCNRGVMIHGELLTDAVETCSASCINYAGFDINEFVRQSTNCVMLMSCSMDGIGTPSTSRQESDFSSF